MIWWPVFHFYLQEDTRFVRIWQKLWHRIADKLGFFVFFIKEPLKLQSHFSDKIHIHYPEKFWSVKISYGKCSDRISLLQGTNLKKLKLKIFGSGLVWKNRMCCLWIILYWQRLYCKDNVKCNGKGRWEEIQKNPLTS